MSAAVTTVAPAANDDVAHGIVPLSTWMEFVNTPPQSDGYKNNFERSNKESIIRKTTVAYGIVELLKRSKKLEDEQIQIDNFVVSVSKKPTLSWDDVKGVGIISSGLSLMIEEPSYLSALLEGEDSDGRIVGRWLEVEMTSADHLMMPAEAETTLDNVWNDYLAGMNVLAAEAEESNRCHLIARLLYELFTHELFPTDALAVDAASTIKEPAQKKAKPSHDVSSRENLMRPLAKGDFDRAEIRDTIPNTMYSRHAETGNTCINMPHDTESPRVCFEGGWWSIA